VEALAADIGCAFMQTDHGTDYAPRWQPHPLFAALLRAFVLLTPIVASVVAVHLASRVVAAPVGSDVALAAWWIGLAVCATVVLIGFDRLTRRLLPLAALLKLALVFPDEAPSRFRTALAAGTTADLERRLAEARAGSVTDTPVEAAERLLGFVAALSTHDRLTRGHSERVRAYAQMIAKELRLGSDDLDRLNWAALLHDIGKLEVPAEILNKPGRPTDEEWLQIRSHPELGARLAAPLRAWLGEWTDAISDHHERWDGKGYPAATEGDRISLGGRIVAVADVFDVITSTRSYKDSGTAVDARDEIARCSGAQFDPRVVRAFLSVSLGRLRLAMGPLSWLAQAPVIGRIPLAPGLVTAASSAVAVLGSVAAGLAGGHGVAPSFTPAAQAAATRPVAQVAPRGAAALAVFTPQRRGGRARLTIASAPVADPALQLVSDAAPTALPAATDPPAAPAAVTPAVTAPLASPLPVAPPAAAPPAAKPPAVTPPVTPPVAPPAPAPGPAPVAPPLNHAPSFVAGADQAVLEDAGARTVIAWAHAISPGPADEAGQTVSFQVSDDNASLFTAGGRPAVAPDGTLTYTPAPDGSGTAAVSVTAIDDGGTAGGGSDASAAQVFQIVVTPVNDAPGFTVGADQSVVENAGAQTVPAWATAIARGPADESGQTVSFTVTSSAPALFAAGGQPAVAAGGALSYTPAPGAHGSATVTVRAVDDGGTANGGVDTSAPQTFAITIVNQAPVAVADAPAVLENDPAGVTFDVLANDTDPESDPLTLASYDGSTIADGGLTHNAGGSFTYIPVAHFAGTDSFSYTVSDGNGGTSTAVVTITITAVLDPPAPQADAYVTPQGVALVETPAGGLLANDSDSSGGPLTVDTTPVAGPANGALSLAADGSFTYTPTLGFTGTDTFTYRVTSAATALSADAVATITVSATFSSTTLYLTGSGPSSEVWNLSTATPASSLFVPDYDGDLFPGLTIKGSNGSDTGDPQRSQTWTYPVAGGLVLNGPVVLHLTSSGSGSNVSYAYLYDCTAGGVTCTQIGFGTKTFNGLLGLGFWTSNDITVGTVNRTLPAGHELRLRLYSGSGDQWVAMTAGLPTSLTLTVP
jgi:putative nucleotidyltransferase with HDIG domain